MNAHAATSSAQVAVERIAVDASPEAVAERFACACDPAILESTLVRGSHGRFSIYAADPLDVFEVQPGGQADVIEQFERRVDAYPRVHVPRADLPFAGGWIGYLAYEAGLEAERITPTTSWDVDLPLARFALYDSAAVFDHQAGCWFAVVVDWPEPMAGRRPSVADRIATLRRRLESAKRCGATETHLDPTATQPVSNMTLDEYFALVDRAKRYIEAGDIYQVNLTRRLTVRTSATPIQSYLRLRQASPGTHAALLSFGDRAVISSSPELFLSLRGRRVVTQPIKGTRARSDEPSVDARCRAELACSEKDAAELNMIVDLLRNDLGRVCAFGTVRVVEPGRIEQFATVYHRVATITGELRADCSRFDLLRAAFPGGSITGTPKIRAMQIIDELEPTARGVYCGSIGYLGLDGTMSLNVAIRTMVQVGDRVYVHAGGAIVADSDKAMEHEEVVAKSRAMLESLGCTEPVVASANRPLVAAEAPA